MDDTSTTFEHRMSQDLSWAMTQADLFFEGRGLVQESLRRLADRFEVLAIPYAVIGGMAMFVHGFRRFTDTVDVLVAECDLTLVHAALIENGYSEEVGGARNLRDSESGVKIQIHTSGRRQVACGSFDFPSPAEVAETIHGVRYIRLPNLIELKLAAGSPSNIRDHSDVQELIRTLALPRSFALQVHVSLRSKFDELWVPPPRDDVDEH